MAIFQARSALRMTLEFVKPSFAQFYNIQINTKPSLGFNFVHREKYFLESEMLGAEYVKNKVLQLGSGTNNLSNLKPPLHH